MINVQKRLERIARETDEQIEQHTAVTEATRLLAEDGAHDLGILRHMGMHANVEYQINTHSRALELQQLRTQHGLVFTETEIKQVAVRYALKFRRSDSYKGPIDPVLPRRVKEFFDKNEINAARLGTNMYVLAPAEAFVLRQELVVRPPDPILFYKTPSSTNYILIHKWGRDLTPWRFLQGLRYKSHFLFWLYYFVPFAIGAIAWWNVAARMDRWYWWLGAVCSTIWTIAYSVCAAANADGHVRFAPWEEIWNDDREPKTARN